MVKYKQRRRRRRIIPERRDCEKGMDCGVARQRRRLLLQKGKKKVQQFEKEVKREMDDFVEAPILPKKKRINRAKLKSKHQKGKKSSQVSRRKKRPSVRSVAAIRKFRIRKFGNR